MSGTQKMVVAIAVVFMASAVAGSALVGRHSREAVATPQSSGEAYTPESPAVAAMSPPSFTSPGPGSPTPKVGPEPPTVQEVAAIFLEGLLTNDRALALTVAHPNAWTWPHRHIHGPGWTLSGCRDDQIDVRMWNCSLSRIGSRKALFVMVRDFDSGPRVWSVWGRRSGLASRGTGEQVRTTAPPGF